ncbi:hypothetical protein [Mumia zhuanghuii]|uniref:Uncharacterized protein n=1 Tax=Mumia zhuanghuii TaxID=2585211 RepID=A0A5C4MV95_9ACTN|nr:hypothetical protein [Mumia zhuanghuii]TNC49294.1 hypothetical protein FHE65_05640 [Mumia zhuanghuii]TNC49683.1 hypothetical protein FHE65_05250 [Mumia zhuanghuii]
MFTQKFLVESADLLPVPEPDNIVPESGTHMLSFTDIAGPIEWGRSILYVSFDRENGPEVPRGSRPAKSS